MEAYIAIAAYCFVGLLFVGGALVASKLVAFTSENTDVKGQPYECGIEAFGDSRIRFKIGYFIYALIFLVFDVESLFLYPCMRIFKQVVETGKVVSQFSQPIEIAPIVIFMELSVFFFVLIFGLIYAWRKGALKWE
ncbi:MAG: NADH-quinone oxidoreductase subunit I [Planctomycetota bacterium]|nr:MAG: NADH-quinone oxidoreductase subunit I [Planctomycetota bacterium]